MLTPDEIIKKVGADKIREALKSNNGEDMKKLLENEGIELTPEQLDHVAGGSVFWGGPYTNPNHPHISDDFKKNKPDDAQRLGFRP